MTISTADFELLLQANRILSSKLDITDVLQAVMELATKVVRAEASSLLLLDAAANELYFDVSVGGASASIKQMRLKVGEGIAGWVAKELQPLIVNDVNKDPRFATKIDKSTSFVTKSILAVPLVSKGQLIGVVEAINKEMNGEFSEQDREAFEIFAGQSAVAIENARMFTEMTREREKLSTVFREMSDGVLLLNAQGRVELANDAASRWLGVKTDQLVGRVWGPDLFAGFEATPRLVAIDRTQGRLTSYQLSRHVVKDLYLGALLLRLENDEHTVTGALVILRDETEERSGDRLKSNFLSLISHKLKTPLTVIVGYAPLLQAKMDNMTESQKKAVTSIAEQGEHLNSLVDKLLKYTTVESESLDRHLEPRHIGPLMDEALRSLDIAESPSVRVIIDPGMSGLPPVLADAAMLTDVFKNVIENGVKFNNKKNKTIGIGGSVADGHVTVWIEDNGIGIPSEEREKVFLKFYQIENSFTGQIPGAGLGLALCKRIVEAMHGRIEIDSTLDRGTRVSIRLPLKKKPTVAAC
jgi:signal transduction histidine kinase